MDLPEVAPPGTVRRPWPFGLCRRFALAMLAQNREVHVDSFLEELCRSSNAWLEPVATVWTDGAQR